MNEEQQSRNPDVPSEPGRDSERVPEAPPAGGGGGKSQQAGKGRPKASLKNQIMVSLIAATIGGVFTFMTALLTTDWFPKLLGFKIDEIRLVRRITYARILYFRDRHKGEEPVIEKVIGYKDKESNIRGKRKLYDEGLYIDAYYLTPHSQSNMGLHAHSSGLVSLTPIIPTKLNFFSEAYRMSKGANIQGTLDIKDRNYVVVAKHYYNGFQYNETKKAYESDGGVHIRHPTDSCTVIFDFSGIDYESLLKSRPVMKFRKISEEPYAEIPSTWTNGVLVAEVTDLSVGTRIICDWEWTTEN